MILRAAIVLTLVLAVTGCGRAVAADQTERSASGAIVEPGELGTEHLRVGDCIQDPIPAEVGALYGVPCGRSHAAQVFAVVADTAGCLDAVDETVAALVDRDDLPEIDVSALLIEDGGRVVCVLEFAADIAEDLVRPSS